MHKRSRSGLVSALLFGVSPLLVISQAPAAESAGPKPVSFTSEIAPIFTASCSGCHEPQKKKGGLDLTTVKAAMAGAKKGPVIVPGHPEKSALIDSISGDEPDMPKKGDKLTSQQVELIARWVREGAKDDAKPAPVATNGGGAPGPAPIAKAPVYAAPPVISAMVYSPDGKYLAISGFNEVLLYKADGSGLAKRLLAGSSRIEALAFSADSKLLACSGGSPALFGQIHIWSMADDKLVGNYKVGHDTLFGLSLSPDGQRLAFGCTDKSAHVIAVKNGAEMLRLDQHTDWCLGTAFTVDGKRLLTGSRDKALKLTDLSTGQFIDDVNNPLEQVLCMTRHPKEDLVLYGGETGEARIYKIKDNQNRTAARNDTNLVRTFERLPNPIHSVAWSPDGKLVAFGSVGEVRVYDAAKGNRISTMSGFEGAVFAVAFSANSRRLATGGYDGQIRVFCPVCGQKLTSFNPVPTEHSKVAVKN